MAGFSWDWTAFIQNAGIIASLLLSGYACFREERSRRVSNLITIAESYRDVWNLQNERPGLARVKRPDVDLERNPITDEEEMFVTVLVFHLDAAYEAMRSGMLERLPGLAADARQFFALPIPKAVWKRLKPFQNMRLVRFIEQSRKVPVGH